jgi:hypothetical protein
VAPTSQLQQQQRLLFIVTRDSTSKSGRFPAAAASYNLAADPGEPTDVASPEPELVNAPGRRLQTWRALQIEYYGDNSLQSEYRPSFTTKTRDSLFRLASEVTDVNPREFCFFGLFTTFICETAFKYFNIVTL